MSTISTPGLTSLVDRPSTWRDSAIASRRSNFSSVLGRIEQKPGEAPEEAARRSAEQFVALTLVQPLLKEVRDANQAAPPFAPTQGEKQFQGLMDAELAQRIVKSSKFGLVDRLVSDMMRKAAGSPAESTTGAQK